MLSKEDLVRCRVAVDLKIASLRRGQNTAKEPAFRDLFTQELNSFTLLQSNLLQELANEQVPSKDVSGKKP